MNWVRSLLSTSGVAMIVMVVAMSVSVRLRRMVVRMLEHG